MKTFTSLISFVLVISLSYCKSPEEEVEVAVASKKVPMSEIKFKQGEGVTYHDGIPFTGEAFSEYESGVKAISAIYIDGKKNGPYIKWFPSGLKSFESNYANDKRHGETISWWKNKNIRSKSNYVNGVGEGEQWQWYFSGAKFKRIQLVNGREQGIQQSWRENGKLYNNYEARDGRVFGLKRSKLCYKLDDEIIQFKK